MATEIALNDLDPAYVRELDPEGWYAFLCVHACKLISYITID